MIETQYVRWFVIGAMMDVNFNPTPASPEYLERCISVVIRYLQGTQRLDGSCSDIQCSLAHIAEKYFKPKEELL